MDPLNSLYVAKTRMAELQAEAANERLASLVRQRAREGEPQRGWSIPLWRAPWFCRGRAQGKTNALPGLEPSR
jgi:hypothetical protein